MNDKKAPKPIPGDNPIHDSGDDLLERADAAEAFAHDVLALDVNEGATVGLFGPWGSGKTSFVNLARKTFESRGVPVLDFNPWLFSGTEQLVGRFFAELSAQMDERNDLKNIVTEIGRLSIAFSGPVSVFASLLGGSPVGKSIEAVLKTIGVLASPPKSINKLRANVVRALVGRDKPIIVILDDVDRLSSPEIRDIFKLVRLTASFPNIVYILLCDRPRVERALGEEEQGREGREYLEKIIQRPYRLPEIREGALYEQIQAAIDGVFADIENPGPFNEEAWRDIRADIVRPLIRNMRDVRRYAIAVRGTVTGLKGEVERADVLGLEAIRLFLPNVFECLPGAAGALTVTTPWSGAGRDSADKGEVDALIKAGETRQTVVQVTINHLFPAGRRHLENAGKVRDLDDRFAAWMLRERRVAHEHFFRLYLARVVDKDIPAFRNAEQALTRMGDGKALEEFLRSLDFGERQGVLDYLPIFESRFEPEHVEPGTTALLNILFDPLEYGFRPSAEARSRVEQAVISLLRASDDSADLESTVEQILSNVRSLSGKRELVRWIGHEENGHKLVSETAAGRFKEALCGEIQRASDDDLAEEPDSWQLLTFVKDDQGKAENRLEVRDSPRLTFSILWSTDLITKESSNMNKQLYIHMLRTNLPNMYGSEEMLKARVESMDENFENLRLWIEKQKKIPLDEAERLRQLANEYFRDEASDLER